jgi:1,4-alpha-glucan branching enzyme
MVQKRGKSQLTFVFRPNSEAIQRVGVAGTFNNWDPDQGKMIRQKDGSYRKRLQLEPGEHRYKFLVDGEWVPDPEAEQQVPNPFGTVDSLVTV